MAEWTIWQKVLPGVIILLSFTIGIIIKKTILKRLGKMTEKSKSHIDDILVKSLSSVILLWFVLLGVFLSTQLVPLQPKETKILQQLFQALLVFSIFWFLMQLISQFFHVYIEKRQSNIPAASIIKNTIKIFVLSIGLLIILQILGISVTPIITTLGVGGLAVALALQDTLANLFSGFQIIATKRVKPKDYIQLDSGEEGYVVDINWRDTVLRQLPGNHIIIPNSKLSSAIVTNFYRPKKAMNVLVEVGVDYDSDLEMVEQVTLEVARESLKDVPGGVEKFEAFMRYHTFADSSINFTVTLRCEEFFDRYLLQHEFIKRLKRRYDAESINIPFPIRTVIMKEVGTPDQ
jgi:small-conductance mechanosensitive channel